MMKPAKNVMKILFLFKKIIIQVNVNVKMGFILIIN
jgi:hypothetical protein